MTTIRSAEIREIDGNQYPTFDYPTAQAGDRVIIMIFGGNQVTWLGSNTWTHHDKRTGQEAQGGIWSRIVDEDDFSTFDMDGSDPIRAAVIVVAGNAPLSLLEVGRDGTAGSTFPAYSEAIAGTAVAGSTAFYFTGARNSTDVPTCDAGTQVEIYSGTHTAGLWREDFAADGPISANLGIPQRSGHYRAAILLGPNYPSQILDPIGVSAKREIGPATTEDDYAFGGITRVREGVALALWEASDYGAASGESSSPWPYIGIWARAMIWTSDGPVLGPLTGFDSDEADRITMSAVLPGRESEAWWVGVENDDTGDLRCGVVRVNQNLTCTLTANNPIGNLPAPIGMDQLAASWPEEDLVIMVKNDAIAPSTAPATLYLVKVRTGAIVASLDLPAYVEEMSFNIEAGVVALWGELSGQWGIWTVAITPTSISTPVEIFRNTGGSLLRIARATPIPTGWACLTMPMSNYGDAAYMEVSLDGKVFFNPLAQFQGWISPYWDEHNGDALALIYDETTGTPVSLHAAWDDPRLIATQWQGGIPQPSGPLPGTETAYRPNSTSSWYMNGVDLCQVGPGRYFFMVIGSYGKTLDSGTRGNYGQVAWAAGHEVPLLTDGAEAVADVSRQVFRRNQ